MKKTLVIGASENPERYSNIATHRLKSHGHSVILFGNRQGEISGEKIETVWNPDWYIDTVTLYIGPKIQENFYNKIIDLKPRRVIFNPGTENEYFMELLAENNIGFEIACTLVLLSLGNY